MLVELEKNHANRQTEKRKEERRMQVTDQLELWQAHVNPPKPVGHEHAPVVLVGLHNPPFKLWSKE